MITPQTYTHINLNNQDLTHLGSLYIGSPNTDGSWRVKAADSRLVVERRESGSWITKAAFYGENPDFDGVDFDSGDFQTTID